MDRIDLILVHWPLVWRPSKHDPLVPELAPTTNYPVSDGTLALEKVWKNMEFLVKTGRCRYIGTSNFSTTHLERILRVAEIPPLVNQIEMHPLLPQHGLLKWCKEHNIGVVAYRSLGGGASSLKDGKLPLLSHPVLQGIAQNHRASPAQAVLSWLLSKGVCVIPKSTSSERLLANFESQKVALSAAELGALDSMSDGQEARYVDPSVEWNCPGIFAENFK